MAMSVNYLSRKRKVDTVGSRFGFPKAAKSVRKVVFSKYPPRGSDLIGIGPPNTDAYRCVVVRGRVVDKKKQGGPGYKHHIWLDPVSPRLRYSHGQLPDMTSICEKLKQTRKKQDVRRRSCFHSTGGNLWPFKEGS